MAWGPLFKDITGMNNTGIKDPNFPLGSWIQALQQNRGRPIAAFGQFMRGQQNSQAQPPATQGTDMVSSWTNVLQQNPGNPIQAAKQILRPQGPSPLQTMLAGMNRLPSASSPTPAISPISSPAPLDLNAEYERIKTEQGAGAAREWLKAQQG